MIDETDVVVIGAGQAGLSVSHELTAAGVRHVVLERARVGATWASRWDSFRLVTPNHTIRLPGGSYTGDDPHGYLKRDEVVRLLEDYAESFDAPVELGVNVLSVRHEALTGWRVETDAGTISARAVVVATGAYQRQHHPPTVAALAIWLHVIDASEYTNPDALPPGAVLVVGSGQTGCQLAEELFLAGRRVILACGRAPWMGRQIDGRDTFDWMLETGFLDQGRETLTSPDALLLANAQATGAGGGHDLHYRTLAAMGVELAGHLSASDRDAVYFADDLADSVAWGDARRAELGEAIQASRAARGLPVPEIPQAPPFEVTGLTSVPNSELGSVIVATGYRPGYSEMILHPEAFDHTGFPLQADGRSTVLPGLFFVGVHFMRKRKSALLLGVGKDASVVAEQVATAVGSGGA